jgi:hypothetical protein
MEIERQRELGTEGLLEEDCYLAECNQGNLEETSGMKETYWPLGRQVDSRGYESAQWSSTKSHLERALFENNSWMAAQPYVPG